MHSLCPVPYRKARTKTRVKGAEATGRVPRALARRHRSAQLGGVRQDLPSGRALDGVLGAHKRMYSWLQFNTRERDCKPLLVKDEYRRTRTPSITYKTSATHLYNAEVWQCRACGAILYGYMNVSMKCSAPPMMYCRGDPVWEAT
ncbi:hypothetical protein FVE85_1046 [Porphyridium purpureum]|uniref:Uncharacterized protein n=1 Tax=Porphyridium purpureum TaxID=35688 RepID=A0A5J4Z3U2_PORPP|nr:hypothetical protein FVE85_1046 [Porphyridium purpureum]|eukprot:POR8202..scf208_2